jgi:hypothetical protein
MLKARMPAHPTEPPVNVDKARLPFGLHLGVQEFVAGPSRLDGCGQALNVGHRPLAKMPRTENVDLELLITEALHVPERELGSIPLQGHIAAEALGANQLRVKQHHSTSARKHMPCLPVSPFQPCRVTGKADVPVSLLNVGREQVPQVTLGLR